MTVAQPFVVCNTLDHIHECDMPESVEGKISRANVERVWMLLVNVSSTDAISEWSVYRIAAALHLARRTVQFALKALVEWGLLVRNKRRWWKRETTRTRVLGAGTGAHQKRQLQLLRDHVTRAITPPRLDARAQLMRARGHREPVGLVGAGRTERRDPRNPHHWTALHVLRSAMSKDELKQGQALADKAATKRELKRWREAALQAVRDIATKRGPGAMLTTDAVWKLLENRGIPEPEQLGGTNRAMGGIVRTAVHRGWISATGKRQRSAKEGGHSRWVDVYTSNLGRVE